MKTLLRATVMLTVLVAAPILWIYRGPLPGPAQQAVDEMLADIRGWWTGTLETRRHAGRGSLLHADELPLGTPLQPASGRPTPAVVGPKSELAQRMEPLLARLRAQGASEYALENWGMAGQLFRFTCMLPLAEDPDHVRQFEAIAEDPRLAVEQVLAEASQWRSAGLLEH